MSLFPTKLVLWLIFEKNKVDFGGAIYIAIVESYTTLEQITFFSDIAVTLGAGICIEDGSRTQTHNIFITCALSEMTMNVLRIFLDRKC